MKTDEVCDHHLETFGAAALGGNLRLCFLLQGEKHLLYVRYIQQILYQKRSYLASKQPFCEKTNILRYLIKFVMIFPQKDVKFS